MRDEIQKKMNQMNNMWVDIDDDSDVDEMQSIVEDDESHHNEINDSTGNNHEPFHLSTIHEANENSIEDQSHQTKDVVMESGNLNNNLSHSECFKDVHPPSGVTMYGSRVNATEIGEMILKIRDHVPEKYPCTFVSEFIVFYIY